MRPDVHSFAVKLLLRPQKKMDQNFSSVEEMMACTPKPKPWSPPPISESTVRPRTDCPYIRELQSMGLNEAWVDEIVVSNTVIVSAKPAHRAILVEFFKGKFTCLDKRLVIGVRSWDVFD